MAEREEQADSMEFYWDLVSNIKAIIAFGSIGYLFYRFVRPFLKESRYAWSTGVVYFAVMTALYLIPLEIEGAFAYACGIVSASAVMYFLDCRNIEQKLYLSITIYLIDWIAHGIVTNIPRSILFHLLIYQPYVTARPVLGLICYAIVELLSLILYLMMMLLFIHFFHKVYIRKKENMIRRELALMLITPLIVLTGYIAFIFVSNVYLVDFEQYIWRIHPWFLWIQVLYQMVSFLGIITSLFFYQSIKESHRKEKENAVLSGQIAEVKRHIREMEAVYADVRGLKHDMGNHIMAIENLFLKNEQEEAISYLSKLKKQLAKAAPEVKTGNPVTDVILTEKQKEAGERGIAFRCGFYYPEGTNIDVFDISVLLNNALDNALEAAGDCENPYVHMKSWREKSIYMIEIRNNFSGILVMDEDSGLPESTKGAPEHGFGLANMRKVAQKYFGDIDIEQNGNEFVLSVMFEVEEIHKYL